MVCAAFPNDILTRCFFKQTFCFQGKCSKILCKNGGKCIGENLCKCPPRYAGPSCTVMKKLGTKEDPAPNAQAILDAGDSQGAQQHVPAPW